MHKKILLSTLLSLTAVTLPSFSSDFSDDFDGFDGFFVVQYFGAADRKELQEHFNAFETMTGRLITNYGAPNGTPALNCVQDASGTLLDEIMQNQQRFIQLGLLSDLPYKMEKKNQKEDREIQAAITTLTNNQTSWEIQIKEFNNRIKNSQEVGQLDNYLTNLISTGLVTFNHNTLDLGSGTKNIFTRNGRLFFPLKDIFNQTSQKYNAYQATKNLETANALKGNLEVLLNDLQAEFITQIRNYNYMKTQQGILNENELFRTQELKVLQTLVRSDDEASTSIVMREHQGKKEIYFLTAGTKSFADFLKDADAKRDGGQDGLGLGDIGHAGFMNAVFEDPNFYRTASYLVETHPDATFYTAGHSLGAAMSVIIGKTLWELSNGKIQPRILGVATPMPYQFEKFTNSVKNFLHNTPPQNIVAIYSTYDAVPGLTQLVGFENLGINVQLPTQFFATLLQGNIPVIGHHFLSSGYLKDFEQLHRCLFSPLKTYQDSLKDVREALETVELLESSMNEKKMKLQSLETYEKKQVSHVQIIADYKGNAETIDTNEKKMKLQSLETYEKKQVSHVQIIADYKGNAETIDTFVNISAFTTHYVIGIDVKSEIAKLTADIEKYNKAKALLNEKGSDILKTLTQINKNLLSFYNRADTQGQYLAKALGLVI